MPPVRILALETSGTAGSVAALDDERLLAAATLDPGQRTARVLAPAVRDVLAQVGWRPADVQLVAVTAGPGSFTGLRLGVTTAKTFAYAAACDVLGVNTLEVIASQAPPECSPLEVVLDAQRQQLFAGTLARGQNAELIWLEPTRIVDIEAWLASWPAERPVSPWATGPLLEKIADRLGPAARIVDRAFWQPTAVAVGRVALHRHRAGERDDVYQLVPQYLRRSAAEEKFEGKQAAAVSDAKQSGP
jgi:tRNA threonylcarbamoyladenosine biosynthesis protein TsaB